MNKPSTSSSANRYRISFTIRDGEHEYTNSVIGLFPQEPSEEQVVHELVDATRYDHDDLQSQQTAAWQQYERDGHLEIPGDYRLIDDITWEQDIDKDELIRELLEAVMRLLECPDLCVDSLDAISCQAIDYAQRIKRKTEGDPPRFIGDYEPGMITPANLTVLANCRRKKDAQSLARAEGGRVVPYTDGRYKRGWVVTTRP